MKNSSNKYLIVALLLGVLFHGTAVFFTLESTYDALIHLFFADHYANSWFEPWNPKWYTGFTVMSYPPLVHQSIAVLSFIGGLKFGMFMVAILGVILFITGVYRFTLLISASRTVAGYAAIVAVFSSSFVETLHLFGQLPSIIGVSVLMHALPEIYLFIKTGRRRYLWTSLSLIAVTVTSHHVTPIFGMVFFIFPLIGMVIMDRAREQVKDLRAVTFRVFWHSFLALFWRIVSFGILSLVVIVGCMLPYWINTKNNPIAQVPIPHGSRDNFVEVTSSGLVFFTIPWGAFLFLMPYFFYRYYHKRYLFFGLSFTLLFILGTGGTTPIPRIILGENAFNILTLDRFTLWASIMALPLVGEFVFRFTEGDIMGSIQNKFGGVYHRLLGGILAGLFIFMTIFSMSISYFRPSQPQRIKMLPIVNFINQDEHYKWRYMTLGFGDQMAWLSAQTKALSVDGNYHSARRLPELTTRPIERLENSKFKGVEGIGSLQQFLAVPERYNLKYVFSNDKFYDPILYFCGWQRLRRLENGIMVWEKLSVPPLASILPKQDVAQWQKVLWGIVPFITVLLAFLFNVQFLLIRTLKTRLLKPAIYMGFSRTYLGLPAGVFTILHLWGLFLLVAIGYGVYLFYIKNDSHLTPENATMGYFDALDFKRYEEAYALINPDSDLSMEQYMLEISVTDGLLSSYAKLDELTIKLKSKNDSLATLVARTKWITPLEKISKDYYKSLVKKNGKWYLQPTAIDSDLPPDQLYTSVASNYYNQGRRRVTTEATHHEDILKQPELQVLSAKLVQNNGQYAIIGELQNVDNVPTDIVVKGSLYSKANKLLARHNAKYTVKHRLMPKEVSSFRVDFEGIAWSEIRDSIPDTFDPDEFTPIELKKQPVNFDLQIAGNITSKGLYKETSYSVERINEKGMEVSLFNGGVEEVTIPQLIVSYYDTNKELLWVDHRFLNDGIRQERKQNFSYQWVDDLNPLFLTESLDKCFINGYPNKQISNKSEPFRRLDKLEGQLQAVINPSFKYIKVEISNYIGSPR